MRAKIFASVICIVATCALAQTTSPATQKSELTPAEKLAVTTHPLDAASIKGEYTATAGYIALKDDQQKLRANIFHVAYTLKNANAAKRPVTFVFNGGPGAASVWLHLGTAGPQRIDFPADGSAPKLPGRLVKNEFTWLTHTDLVFIDPVNTGYSRPATPEQGKEFHGVQEDIQAVGEFIRLWLVKNERWQSPKFLAGESYGTTRAAGLSEHLADRHGIALNGIVLISTVLNFGTLTPKEGNDVPFALYLPTYAAVAWQHKKLPDQKKYATLDDLKKDVEKFALDEYAPALLKGDKLDEATRARIAERLVAYTGLSREFIELSNLRVPPARFMKQLMAADRKVVGRFDGRIMGPALDPANDSAEFDPSLTPFYGAYTSTINSYIRETLKYENDLNYEVLSNRVHPWNFQGGGGGGWSGFLYVADDLRNAMHKNNQLKVLVCSGSFDLATPYFAAEHTLRTMGLDKSVRGNVSHVYYPAGHMMYHERSSLEKLHQDITTFIENATK